LIKNKTVKQAFKEGEKAIAEVERKQIQDYPNLQIPSEVEIPQSPPHFLLSKVLLVTN